MCKVVFINKSTSLPLDWKMTNYFNQIFNIDKILDINYKEYNDEIYIFCVSAKELDVEIQNVHQNKIPYPILDQNKFNDETEKESREYRESREDRFADQGLNPDLLGVFIPQSPETNYMPLIKVSPEKIMYAAYNLKKQTMTKRSHLDIYTVLFVSVVLHELGHSALNINEYDFREAYRWISARLDEGDHDQRYLGMLAGNQHYTNSNSYWYRNYQWYKMIEESLANRFILEHQWGRRDKNLIWKYISLQPIEYSAAISWKNTKSVTETLSSWRYLKNDNSVDKILKAFDKKGEFLSNIYLDLEHQKGVLEYDFEKAYTDYCLENIDNWVKTQSPVLYDTFGVLYELSSKLKKKDPIKAIWCLNERLLQETSDDNIANIYKDMAMIYISLSQECDYVDCLQKALKHSIKTSGYWEDKRTEELKELLGV